jgi:hypothetical protein
VDCVPWLYCGLVVEKNDPMEIFMVSGIGRLRRRPL